MTGMSQYVKGFLITLAGIIVLSPDALLIRMLATDDWTIVFYRGIMTAVTLAAFLYWRRGRGVLGLARQMDTGAILAGLLYALGNISFVQSINNTLVSNTLVILAATPLIAALLSQLFLREKQPRETWVAIVLVFGGVGVIFAGSVSAGHLFGDFMALVAATAMAGNLVALRRTRLQTPLPSVILGGMLAALVSFSFAAPLAISANDLLILVILGVVVMPISFGLIFTGPKYIPAPDVALIMLLEAILGPLLVWAVLSEAPTLRVVLAGLLMITTIGLHALVSLRRSNRTS